MQITPSLKNIDISGFRGFSKLNLPRLGQVNLFVGKNKVGKTSLLEAIDLYLANGRISTIVDLLVDREEFSLRKFRETEGRMAEPLNFESLFFGRPDLEIEQPSLHIGPVRSRKKRLSIEFAWLRQVYDEEEDFGRIERVVSQKKISDATGVEPGLEIKHGTQRRLITMDRINRYTRGSLPYRREKEIAKGGIRLSPAGMTIDEIGRIWDGIALTDDEEEVVSALRLISDKIDKLVLVESPRRREGRIVMTKLRDFQQPVPLSSLGEGIRHLLSIALVLIKGRNGVLMIDEVENGIHYSIQRDVWNLIFQQSQEWNTQVFATTHSWDCVEGFLEAARIRPEIDTLLIRLQGENGDIEGVIFEPHELEIATREKIEVR